MMELRGDVLECDCLPKLLFTHKQQITKAPKVLGVHIVRTKVNRI
jgi:hypothetical protein